MSAGTNLLDWATCIYNFSRIFCTTAISDWQILKSSGLHLALGALGAGLDWRKHDEKSVQLEAWDLEILRWESVVKPVRNADASGQTYPSFLTWMRVEQLLERLSRLWKVMSKNSRLTPCCRHLKQLNMFYERIFYLQCPRNHRILSPRGCHPCNPRYRLINIESQTILGNTFSGPGDLLLLTCLKML